MTNIKSTTSPAAPAPTTKRFDHPGRPVFVLVPVNHVEERKIVESLSDDFEFCEEIPKIKSEVKPLKLPQDAVLYVAHYYDTRVKNAETGKFSSVQVLHVSEPLELKKMNAARDVDGMVVVDPNTFAFEVTNRCKNSRAGRFLRAALSGYDIKKPLDILLKLSET